jgi:signal peptidase I
MLKLGKMQESELQTAPKPQNTSRQETLAFIWETVKVVIVSLAIVIPIRYFLVQPFFVKGASMETTFDDGDYILIDEISYRFKEPARGDVVIFRYPADQSQFFIKRIVGLPEETVEIKDNKVVIYNKQHPEGFVLNESYLDKSQHTAGNSRFKLDPNEYFVLGDNRLQSSDSRRWGPVNRALITGRVFLRAWPINKFGELSEVNYQ